MANRTTDAQVERLLGALNADIKRHFGKVDLFDLDGQYGEFCLCAKNGSQLIGSRNRNGLVMEQIRTLRNALAVIVEP